MFAAAEAVPRLGIQEGTCMWCGVYCTAIDICYVIYIIYLLTYICSAYTYTNIENKIYYMLSIYW